MRLFLLVLSFVSFQATFAEAQNAPVRCVQEELLAAGFDPNGIDNALGNGTRQAANAWLNETGNDSLPPLSESTSRRWCNSLRAYNGDTRWLTIVDSDELWSYTGWALHRVAYAAAMECRVNNGSFQVRFDTVPIGVDPPFYRWMAVMAEGGEPELQAAINSRRNQNAPASEYRVHQRCSAGPYIAAIIYRGNGPRD